MGKVYDLLLKDVRFTEGMNSCINCGTCTAICPAAEFYNYQPRKIVDLVQSRDEEALIGLLKSETIWYCGECMSCKTRCPRGNAPGLIIIALRSLSQELGYFTESEKGRQMLAIKRTIGEWILKYGYCLYPPEMDMEGHPEQGPIWEWELQHLPEIFEKVGGNYNKPGAGTLRRIPQEALDELRAIFDVTGGTARFEKIEAESAKVAEKMGMDFQGGEDQYFKHVFNAIQINHHHS